MANNQAPKKNTNMRPRRGMASLDFKAITQGGTLKRLLKMIFSNKQHRIKAIIIMIAIIFTVLGNVASSVFMNLIISGFITPVTNEIVDNGAGAEAINQYLPSLIGTLVGLGAIYLTSFIAYAIYTQLLAILGQQILNDMRIRMFNKMETLPIKYFDQNSHGDIMSHYTNDVDSIRQFITQSLPQLYSTVIAIVAFVCAMLYYSIYLFLVVCVGIAVMLLVIKNFGAKSTKYFFDQQVSVGKIEGYIEEMMNGLKVIKVFTHEEKVNEGFDIVNGELRENSNYANYYGNILMPVLNNLGNITYVIVGTVAVVLYAFRVPNVSIQGLIELATTGTMSALGVATIVSFLMQTRSLTQNIGQISQQFAMCAMAIAGTQRIFDLLDQESEVDNGYVTLVNAKYDENGNLVETEERTHIWAWKHPHGDGTLTYTELRGDIVLDDVDFGYTEQKTILHNVSIYAHPGQKIAFVGATGAGKTTITNLINRFYPIQDGKIRYDGININKIKKDDLRRSLGIVLQDTNLFTTTVRENIRYGRLDATDEEVYEAAKIANAYDFITRLPQGFDTVLTADGANLSQGQRQLLSIARAAVADAPVMILDEATSSIDTRTELLVQNGMDRLMEGRTVFVIAHRLSTVQNSNAIIVLDHGRIIERGDHDDLIKQKGVYYQLYTGAFELE